MDSSKTCFLICPIGNQGSDANQRSWRLLREIVRPTLQRFGFQVTHFLETDYRTEHIRRQMMEQLATASVCIADLTGNNPNVLFEYGWRRAANLPILPLVHAAHTDELLFDVDDYKTGFYDPAHPAGAIAEIERFLEQKGFGIPQVRVGSNRGKQSEELFRSIVEGRARRINILHVSGAALGQTLFDNVRRCSGATFCMLLLHPDKAVEYAAHSAHRSDVEGTLRNVRELVGRAAAYRFELPTIGVWLYRHEPSIAAVIVDRSYIQLGWYLREPAGDDESGLVLKGHNQPCVIAHGEAAAPVIGKISRHFRTVWKDAEFVADCLVGPAAGKTALLAEWKTLKDEGFADAMVTQ